MSTVLLLKMMGGWDRWRVVNLYQGLDGGGGRGWVLSYTRCFFLLVLLSFVLSCLLVFF